MQLIHEYESLFRAMFGQVGLVIEWVVAITLLLVVLITIGIIIGSVLHLCAYVYHRVIMRA